MSRTGRHSLRAVPTVAILALAATAALSVHASPNGYTGRTATNSGGCGSCHSTLSGTTALALSGPASLAPGATGTYTCVVTHTRRSPARTAPGSTSR